MQETQNITPNDANEVENGHESDKPVLPYPKRVFFIICTEFCERFNYYGMNFILYVYLRDKLNLDPKNATIQSSVFSMINYFSCIIGGVLSDACLGRFKTIAVLSIIYAIGSAMVATGAVPQMHESGKVIFYLGLLLIALGCGGIKPCVSAFGGDQFQLPEQSVQMDAFFSIFYAMINVGSLISSVTPSVKENVHCFGEKDCYSLAFGIPAILMLIAVVFFIMGRSSYTMVPPSGNMIVKVVKCIWNAIITKWHASKSDHRDHFLDYSIEKCGLQLVNDTKSLLNILILLIPLPFFWFLYSQQGSYWIEQASKMNLNLSFVNLPKEQMQALNPILIIILIPVFDYWIYPLLSKIGLRKPLQKMSVGGILASFAFLLAAIVQYEIENRPLKSLSVLWQIPQIVVISMAEIMFSVTSLSFSFEQAPKSMKSVVQAAFLLTVAFGSALLIIFSSISIFKYQSYDFILYEVLMLVDMIFFMILAHRYKPNLVN